MRLRGSFLLASMGLASSCNFLTPFAGDQLGETVVKARCHFIHACCAAGEWDNPALGQFSDLTGYRSESECVQEEVEEGTNSWFGIPGSAIRQAEQAGRFSFDNNQAALCLQPFVDAANKCDADAVIGDAGEPLDPVLCDFSAPPGDGKVKDEDPCYFAWECATKGSQCVRPVDLLDIDNVPEIDSGDTVTIQEAGVCVPPVAIDDDCEPDPDVPNFTPSCEPGSRCLPDRNDLVCTELKTEGDNCDDSFECEPGLYCDRECTALKPDGDNCDDGFECESGQCIDRDCGSNPVDVLICNGVQGGDDVKYEKDGTE
jgi:hypothetical protein